MAGAPAQPALADDQPSPVGNDTRRADLLRQQAQANALAAINTPYPTVPVYGTTIDYYALSQQIARLAAYIQVLAQTSAPQYPASTGAFAGLAPGVDPLARFGPEGPNERTVRIVLEYQLLLAGNPRLRVGEVRREGEGIVADVVTAEGSLVESYAVDVATGVWTPVR